MNQPMPGSTGAEELATPSPSLPGTNAKDAEPMEGVVADPSDNLFPSPGRHYYLAVDHTQFKTRTLLELLGVVADRRGGLPIAICVSSRDELDAVCAAVANLPFVSMSPLVNHNKFITYWLVATDACLPQAAMAEAPLLARVLMNYQLPTKKEAYLRRMSTCLAADEIVINMVVGGEVATLKALEENSGLLIAEVTTNVSERL
nr:unnamed protein product [Digitaria exilis]